MRILERLTSGISAPHIWRVEKLTVRRALRIIAECDRQPAGFVQLQIPQISHATIVTQTMMKRSSSDQARMQPRPPSWLRADRKSRSGRAAAAVIRPTAAATTIEADAKFSASQPPEIARNRETISKASPTLEHRNLSPAVLCGGGLPLERAP